MDVIDCIRTRRSIRKYLDKPVSMDILGQLLEAGRMAPTAGNLQNYKMILVRDQENRTAVSEACHDQHWLSEAPAHIVICSEPQRARQFYYERGEKVYSVQNCANIATAIQLAAWSFGLGSCWVGSFDVDKLAGALGIPSYAEPQIVLTIGYPDEKVPIPDRYKLWDMVFIEKWEARIANIGLATREPSPTYEKVFKETTKKVEGHAEKILGKIKEKSGKISKKVKSTVKKKVADRKKKTAKKS